MNGTDDVAKIRMRSMLAAGQLTAMSAVGLAVTGMISLDLIVEVNLVKASGFLVLTNGLATPVLNPMHLL